MVEKAKLTLSHLDNKKIPPLLVKIGQELDDKELAAIAKVAQMISSISLEMRRVSTRNSIEIRRLGGTVISKRELFNLRLPGHGLGGST